MFIELPRIVINESGSQVIHFFFLFFEKPTKTGKRWDHFLRWSSLYFFFGFLDLRWYQDFGTFVDNDSNTAKSNATSPHIS